MANRNDTPQLERFKETARQPEAYESEAAYDEKLKALTKAKEVYMNATPNKQLLYKHGCFWWSYFVSTSWKLLHKPIKNDLAWAKLSEAHYLFHLVV